MKINQVKLQEISAKNQGQSFASQKSQIHQGAGYQEFSKVSSNAISSLGKSQVNSAKPALMLSFKGGNPKQVVHIMPEGVVMKKGGVATVVTDWVKKFPEYQNDVEHFFVMPYYNGELEKENGLIKGVHTVTKDGKPQFRTTNGELKEIKELASYTIKGNNMDTKTSEDVACKIFDATHLIPKEYQPTSGKARFLMVQSPKTAVMQVPYSDTGFGYLGGGVYENYSEFAKASVEGLPKLKTVEGFGDFDPRNIVIHDYHSSGALNFIREQANNGEALYKDMNIGYIFHNAGRGGYQGIEARPIDIFKSLATPEEFDAVVNSKTYQELFTREGAKAAKEQAEFWQKLMPGFVDEMKEINPSMLPITLGQNGYAKVATVSPGYAEECANNSEFAQGLTEHMKQLKDEGTLKGVTNGLAAPTEYDQISPSAARLYHEDFFKELEKPIKYKDGVEVKPMRTFNPQTLDIDEIAEVKKANKYNFLERLIKHNDVDMTTMPEGIKPTDLVTGAKGKALKVTSTLNADTLASVEQDNAKLFASWGRGDFQKGIDELLTGIKKYVKSSKDDGKSIFVVCGGLPYNEEGKMIQDLVDEMVKMPELQGRFAYMDGWGPASAMGSASDFGVFTSRFEPCGLTPQEEYARAGATIGTNTGGMKSTIEAFDGNNLDTATGFKTSRGFYDIKPLEMSREELVQRKSGEDFLKIYDKAIEKAKADLGTNEITDIVKKNAEETKEVQKAIRLYRDDVISDEIAQQIAKAADLSEDNMKRIHLNAANLKADWDNNNAINDKANSAFDSYKKHFFKDFSDEATAAAPDKKVLFNVDFIEELKKEGLDNTKKSIGDMIKDIPFKGKIGIAVGAAALLAGGIYAYTKKKSKNDTPKANTQSPAPANQPAPQASTPVQNNTTQNTVNQNTNTPSNNMMSTFVKNTTSV